MIERPSGRSLLVMTTDTVPVWSFVTTRKGSLGQGNIFTGIYLSTGGGGLCPQGGLCPGESLSRGGLCPGESLSRGVSVQGVSIQGVSVKGSLCQGDPHGKERAVRILLECILVLSNFVLFTEAHNTERNNGPVFLPGYKAPPPTSSGTIWIRH